MIPGPKVIDETSERMVTDVNEKQEANPLLPIFVILLGMMILDSLVARNAQVPLSMNNNNNSNNNKMIVIPIDTILVERVIDAKKKQYPKA